MVISRVLDCTSRTMKFLFIAIEKVAAADVAGVWGGWE